MPLPQPSKDRPWVMRTDAGHSSPAESKALYRRNLAKGQTGLSVAFDLPTRTGYDPDDDLAAGEVGKVGVPVSHLGDMRALFDGVVGGIVPDPDARRLRELGVARVFTPEDFGITDIMAEVVAVVREANGLGDPVPA